MTISVPAALVWVYVALCLILFYVAVCAIVRLVVNARVRRCRNCKHYVAPPPSLDIKVWGGECEHPHITYSHLAQLPKDGLLCDEGLYIGPDFGCIHWTQRED